MERNRNNRRRTGSRPRTPFDFYTTENECFSVMGYLKGKSSLIIYQKFGTAKFQYRCREFWCRGYYVDTTGKNTQVIKEYIQNQLKKDKENMQLAIDYPEDPFKGSK